MSLEDALCSGLALLAVSPVRKAPTADAGGSQPKPASPTAVCVTPLCKVDRLDVPSKHMRRPDTPPISPFYGVIGPQTPSDMDMGPSHSQGGMLCRSTPSSSFSQSPRSMSESQSEHKLSPHTPRDTHRMTPSYHTHSPSPQTTYSPNGPDGGQSMSMASASRTKPDPEHGNTHTRAENTNDGFTMAHSMSNAETAMVSQGITMMAQPTQPMHTHHSSPQKCDTTEQKAGGPVHAAAVGLEWLFLGKSNRSIPSSKAPRKRRSVKARKKTKRLPSRRPRPQSASLQRSQRPPHATTGEGGYVAEPHTQPASDYCNDRSILRAGYVEDTRSTDDAHIKHKQSMRRVRPRSASLARPQTQTRQQIHQIYIPVSEGLVTKPPPRTDRRPRRSALRRSQSTHLLVKSRPVDPVLSMYLPHDFRVSSRKQRGNVHRNTRHDPPRQHPMKRMEHAGCEDEDTPCSVRAQRRHPTQSLRSLPQSLMAHSYTHLPGSNASRESVEENGTVSEQDSVQEYKAVRDGSGTRKHYEDSEKHGRIHRSDAERDREAPTEDVNCGVTPRPEDCESVCDLVVMASPDSPVHTEPVSTSEPSNAPSSGKSNRVISRVPPLPLNKVASHSHMLPQSQAPSLGQAPSRSIPSKAHSDPQIPAQPYPHNAFVQHQPGFASHAHPHMLPPGQHYMHPMYLGMPPAVPAMQVHPQMLRKGGAGMNNPNNPKFPAKQQRRSKRPASKSQKRRDRLARAYMSSAQKRALREKKKRRQKPLERHVEGEEVPGVPQRDPLQPPTHSHATTQYHPYYQLGHINGGSNSFFVAGSRHPHPPVYVNDENAVTQPRTHLHNGTDQRPPSQAPVQFNSPGLSMIKGKTTAAQRHRRKVAARADPVSRYSQYSQQWAMQRRRTILKRMRRRQ